jgi:polynucleotide 5'-kinase involved in rRNA processing
VREFEEVKTDNNKVLLINTCGWVEGIGAMILMGLVEAI